RPDFCPFVAKGGFHFRLSKNSLYLSIEPAHDLVWRAARRKNAGPESNVEILDAAFFYSRDIRHGRRASRGGESQDLQLVRAHVGHCSRQRLKMEVDAIAENGTERLRTAIEGNVRERCVGSDPQQLAGKISRCAGTCRSKRQAARR